MLARRAPNSFIRNFRNYSTTSAPSLINVLDHQAPHLGVIRVLSLNRPQARNALSRALVDELQTSVATVQKLVDDKESPIRALILASSVDTSFCAGADLKERAKNTPEEYFCT